MQPTTTQAISFTEPDWSETDRRLMARALDLASQGVGQVSPGPLVGCVIAADEEIVGEGFYIYNQVKHAETLALEQAGSRARGATAYVSLEPHAHHGRTPPCTDALIQAGIRRVVAPIEDPNPLVSGKGFEHLRAVGIEVSSGLLAAAAQRVNEKYRHFIATGRPFVHLKMAVSLDGRIATRTGDSRWIAGAESRARAHLLRHEYDAILIGAGTARLDDPLLTDRSAQIRRRPLIRIVLDERLETSPASQLARTANAAPVLIFTGENVADEAIAALENQGVQTVRDKSGGRDILRLLEELGRRSLQSLLVEGGSRVAGAFIDAGLVDKFTFFVAPVIVGGRDARSAIVGEGAANIRDALRLEDVEIIRRGSDVEITGYAAGRG